MPRDRYPPSSATPTTSGVFPTVLAVAFAASVGYIAYAHFRDQQKIAEQQTREAQKPWILRQIGGIRAQLSNISREQKLAECKAKAFEQSRKTGDWWDC